jgi:ABC-2 type transport system permease protein
MSKARALYASFKHQAWHFFADPQWLIPNIIAPFVLTLAVLLIFREVTGDVILYAVLGGGMMGMWGNTLYASGWSIQSDRWWGTIDGVFAAPVPLIWIIGGRALWNTLIGVMNGLLILLIALIVFQAPLQVRDPGLFLLSFTFTLVSLTTLGMLFSAAFVLTRSAQVLTNGLEFPIYVGTGTMFPIALLPAWSSPLSLSLAPTWGIDAMRYATLAEYEWGLGLGYWGDMAMMGLLSLAYLGLAIWLFQRVDMMARRDATMGRA